MAGDPPPQPFAAAGGELRLCVRGLKYWANLARQMLDTGCRMHQDHGIFLLQVEGRAGNPASLLHSYAGTSPVSRIAYRVCGWEDEVF